jgi:ATPase subunit of ABC transporter with duplicated ATPase domains
LRPPSDDAIVVGLIRLKRPGHVIRSSSDRGEAMATNSLSERVSTLEEAVSALQQLPQELAAFRSEVNARFEQVDARFDQVDARFAQIDMRFAQIDAQFERMYSQMRMLHEDLVDRIKALSDGRDARATAPSQRRGKKPKR